MELLAGCWHEALRADVVAAKLVRIRQASESVGLEIYQPLTILLKEVESCSTLLRDLNDLFPIYRLRVPIVTYYFAVLLPSLQKTLIDMLIYIGDEGLEPLKQWEIMRHRLDGLGGLTLAERCAVYNGFLIQTARLLSRSVTYYIFFGGCDVTNFHRSPIYDVANLELLRMGVLRIRSLQGLPGLFILQVEICLGRSLSAYKKHP